VLSIKERFLNYLMVVNSQLIGLFIRMF